MFEENVLIPGIQIYVTVEERSLESMHIGLISNEGRRPTRRVAMTMLLWLSCVGIVSLITWHSNSPHDPTQAFTIKSTKSNGANRLERPVVYELNTAAWLFELSLKYNSPFTLGNTLVMRELGALKKKYTAINVIWFMGIWQKGNAGLQHDRNNPSLLSDFASILPGFKMEDIIGSPYAVQDYTISKDLGTVEDFVAIRSYLQSIGIKVMLDFVPNHTALDNEWAVNHPDFYINAVDAASCTTNCVTINNHHLYTGGDTYQSGWTDTIQLNYWNVNTRSAQIDNLRMMASLSDYIRCDMAMDILNDEISHAWGPKLSATGYNRPATEFWDDAITAVQASYPDTAFIAEAYNYGITATPELDLLRDFGFSFVYEKTILDIMVGISQSTKSTTDLLKYLNSHDQNYYSKGCFFVENHDDNRAAGLNLLGSVDTAVAAAVLISTLPGMKLYYHGQFEGKLLMPVPSLSLSLSRNLCICPQGAMKGC
jgi:hypothetical protein